MKDNIILLFESTIFFKLCLGLVSEKKKTICEQKDNNVVCTWIPNYGVFIKLYKSTKKVRLVFRLSIYWTKPFPPISKLFIDDDTLNKVNNVFVKHARMIASEVISSEMLTRREADSVLSSRDVLENWKNIHWFSLVLSLFIKILKDNHG